MNEMFSVIIPDRLKKALDCQKKWVVRNFMNNDTMLVINVSILLNQIVYPHL